MRILNIACLLIVIITFAGCGSNAYWYKENNRYNKASADCLDCLADAQRQLIDASTQEQRNLGTPSATNYSYEQTLFEKCMKNKGYRKVNELNLGYDIRKGFVKNRDELYFIAGE